MPLPAYSGIAPEDDACVVDLHEEGCCPECTGLAQCDSCIQTEGCGWSFEHGNCSSLLGEGLGLCGDTQQTLHQVPHLFWLFVFA